MLPKLLFDNGETDFQANDDGDANGLGHPGQGKRKLHVKVDWRTIASTFTQSSSNATLEVVESYLLSRPLSKETRAYVLSFARGASNDQDFMKKLFQGFMSLP